ncbi:MAG: DMT family transporter [Gemmatimonadota bacterium]
MERQARAYAYGLATVLLWSTVASAFKLALRHLEPLQLLLYSTVVSTAALAAMLAAGGKLGGAFGVLRHELRRSLALGFLNPFLYYVILFEAYDRLPAQEAQPLNYTWALTLALLSIPLLKQRLLLTDLAAGAVCYAGVLVIATHGDPGGLQLSDPAGVALALGSTLIWALYWIYNTRDTLDPVVRLFLSFLLALPYVLGACLLFSSVAVGSLAGLLGALYVGLIEMGVTFVLWLSALRLAENTSRVGNLIFLSPFLSLVFIHFFVGERILPSTVVGLGLIIGGLAVQRFGVWRAARP